MKVFLLAVLLYVCKLVLDREYEYWGRSAAHYLCRVAGLFTPRAQRRARVAEWLGELDEIQHCQHHAGVLFGLSVLVAGTRLRARTTLQTVRSTLARMTGTGTLRSARRVWAHASITAVTGAVVTGAIAGVEALIRRGP